jgi:S-adenosylmethionine synthetase
MVDAARSKNSLPLRLLSSGSLRMRADESKPNLESNFYFSSESVSGGHPDKLADQISDAVLDGCLRQAPFSRVTCETLVSKELVVVAGEISSIASPCYEALVRDVLRQAGYLKSEIGIDANRCRIEVAVNELGVDIAMGVPECNHPASLVSDSSRPVFGYACDETQELMPLPISLANKIVARLTRARREYWVDWLRPDARCQVTIEYRNGMPRGIHSIVLSAQHDESVSMGDLRKFLISQVVQPTLPTTMRNGEVFYRINPTGRFTTGGPAIECGLTGRNIVGDTYGGFSRSGGSSLSGKDPSKAGRTATYAARYIAKNIVGAGLAKRCEVQLTYPIGCSTPASVYVETFGTSKYPAAMLSHAVQENFPLSLGELAQHLKLWREIYRNLSVGGHFGRADVAVAWEELDRVVQLQAWFGKRSSPCGRAI